MAANPDEVVGHLRLNRKEGLGKRVLKYMKDHEVPHISTVFREAIGEFLKRRKY